MEQEKKFTPEDQMTATDSTSRLRDLNMVDIWACCKFALSVKLKALF